ncbi:MAG: protein kinase domain-containing protein, partial [Planctomycetota bacterium]
MPGDSTSHCPTAEQIERVVAGEMDDEGVCLHVEACRTCGELAERARANNELLKQFTRVTGKFEPDQTTTPADLVIPGYEIVSEIHRGGQGVVYKAAQKATKREVALKMLIHEVFATPRQRRRFEREIELAAGLRHRHIVTVYDSGVTSEGFHYYAMEYIDGVPLSGVITHGRIAADWRPRAAGAEDILRLFVKICDAVSYAHQHGVIHRDLKPGNILIDADGEPHIVDFGVAKTIGPGAVGETRAATIAGEFLGTFAYAAPEQVTGDPSRVNTRTDVYALGLVLYEMLTGRHPYPVDGTLAEVLRNIAEAEPKHPAGFRRTLDEDVSAIVLKALEKESGHRYPSALEFSNDVTRYLAGQAVDARHGSTWYMLRKTARRYRLPVLVAAVSLALVTAFAIDRGIQAERIARQRDVAQLNLHEATIERGRAESRAGNKPLAERLLWREHLNPPTLPPHRAERERSNLFEPAGPIHSYWALWELYSRQPCLATWKADSGEVRAVRYNPDGTILSSAGDDGIKLWQMPSRRLWRRHTDIGLIRSVCFSPDGARLASAGPDIRLWSVEDGRLLSTLTGHESHVDWIEFSPDGGLLASCAGDGTIRLWELAGETCARVIDLGGSSANKVSFSPDGHVLAGAMRDGMIMLFEIPAGRVVASFEGTARAPGWVAFSPDAQTLLAGVDGFLKARQVPTWDRVPWAQPHRANILSGFFSSDGRWLVTGGEDQAIIFWHAKSGTPIHTYDAGIEVLSVCFRPDGDVFASGGSDGTISLWQSTPYLHRRSLEHNQSVHGVRYSHDGNLLAVCGHDPIGKDWSIRLWEAAT